jgi:lysozyme
MNPQVLAQRLMQEEGVKLKPYTDTEGKLTIGVGRNLTDKGISQTEALFLLSNDIHDAQSDVRKALPWFDRLNEARQEVLVDMAFNMGLGVLLGFKNTLALVQAGKYDEAADAMVKSLWAKQVGQRAVQLADMMKKGA